MQAPDPSKDAEIAKLRIQLADRERKLKEQRVYMYAMLAISLTYVLFSLLT